MRNATIVGIGLTTVLLGAFGFLAYANIESAREMDLNEWGDFLAGACAPLALLWLVIGYFQQGAELKLNTKALEAQQEELKRQVEETAFLARNSERQAVAAEAQIEFARKKQTKEEEEERIAYVQAQPIFRCDGGTTGHRISSNIRNDGGVALDIELGSSGPNTLQLAPVHKWESGDRGKLLIEPPGRKGPIEMPFEFSISYTDKFGDRHKKTFHYRAAHDFREIGTELISSGSMDSG